MRPLFFSIFCILTVVASAQQIDYNTDHGVMAEGYDVVAYFSEEAIKGEERYSTTHNGVRYQFATQKNLDTFLQNPSHYIPQYGGYCAYAIGVKSEKVGINPKTFEIRDDKLYLFYNAWGTNTLKKWKEEGAEHLAKEADKNWQDLKYSKE